MPATMKKRESLRGPGGIMIVLDANEIFPDDPGNGTPAMVYLPFGRGSATYWCAQNEGEVQGDEDYIQLTNEQQVWLNDPSIDKAVTDWIELRSNAIQRDGREAVLAVLK